MIPFCNPKISTNLPVSPLRWAGRNPATRSLSWLKTVTLFPNTSFMYCGILSRGNLILRLSPNSFSAAAVNLGLNDICATIRFFLSSSSKNMVARKPSFPISPATALNTSSGCNALCTARAAAFKARSVASALRISSHSLLGSRTSRATPTTAARLPSSFRVIEPLKTTGIRSPDLASSVSSTSRAAPSRSNCASPLPLKKASSSKMVPTG